MIVIAGLFLMLAFLLCLLGGFKIGVPSKDLGWFGMASFMAAVLCWAIAAHLK
jgi:hypothetical protein